MGRPAMGHGRRTRRLREGAGQPDQHRTGADVLHNHGEFRNCLRLNFGYPWTPQAEQAIATLGRIVYAVSPTIYKDPCGGGDTDRRLIRSCFCSSDPGAQHSLRSQEGMLQESDCRRFCFRPFCRCMTWLKHCVLTVFAGIGEIAGRRLAVPGPE